MDLNFQAPPYKETLVTINRGDYTLPGNEANIPVSSVCSLYAYSSHFLDGLGCDSSIVCEHTHTGILIVDLCIVKRSIPVSQIIVE